MPIDPHTSRNPNPSLWLWTVSIGLGALALAIIFPILMLVAGGSIIYLSYLLVQSSKQHRQLSIEIDQAILHQQDALRIADLLRGLINAADIPVLATDDRGRIAHINQQASDVLGIGQALLSRRFDEIMPQSILHELESLARKSEPGHARLSIPINGEMRDFDISADPVPISSGAVITFRDITELSRAMTLKADFVANASHELRTPIASIKIAVVTLSGPAKDDPQMSARLIEMIASNADRLELLANDLLDLSKAETQNQPIKVEPVHVHELTERIFEGFTAAASRKNISLIAQIDSQTQTINSDSTLLALILRNLIQNAIKFAHEETSVIVRVDPAEVIPDRQSPVPTELNQSMGVAISVIDTGIGIPLAQQQRVFERFYQVDDARAGSSAKRGSGLGLAIAKHAVKRLGGHIEVESVHQIGTTMRVKLPRCLNQSPDSD